MRRISAIGAALAALALASCGSPAPQPRETLHQIMAGSIDPLADVIWGETSKAYGDDGRPQPGKLTPEEWAKVEQAARDMRVAAEKIASDPDIEVTKPGAKLLDEGRVPEAVTAAQVALYVQRDRPGLAVHARELMKEALDIENAAKARDSVKAVYLAEQLDEVCEQCHVRYWYPEQNYPGNKGASAVAAATSGATGSAKP